MDAQCAFGTFPDSRAPSALTPFKGQQA